MTKALIKKQLLEAFFWVYTDRKRKTRREKSGILGYGLLYLMLFVFLGFMMFRMADWLCAPLLSARFGWLYIAIMSLLGMVLGVFGSVFNTYASLYQAKDNDLLLSLPIPPSRILMVRLIGVYAVGLLYELIVMIPAMLAFWIYADLDWLGYLCSGLIPLVLSVFVLVLSCTVGFFVALIGARLKHKNIVIVLASLAFIVVYYLLYHKAYTLLQSVLVNPQVYGDQAKKLLYPLYHLGLAAEGEVLSLLIVVIGAAAVLAVIYWMLSRSFTKLATTRQGTAKTAYKTKKAKAGTLSSALLYKELRRFFSSPTYLLNCGLSTILMVIVAVALLIKGDALLEVVALLPSQFSDSIPLMAVAAIGMMASVGYVTAPSISMEGSALWIVRSLPVSGRAVLLAKGKAHLLINLPSVLLLCFTMLAVFRPTWQYWLLAPLFLVLMVIAHAEWGLLLNLKFHRFDWASEVVPVKQGISVLLAMFGGWGSVVLLGVGYYLLRAWFSPIAYLSVATCLVALLAGLLLVWLRNKGSNLFEQL